MSSYNKKYRLLDLYDRIMRDENINKENFAGEYEVSTKTVQRDIDDIRSFIHQRYEFEPDVGLNYDTRNNVYYLEKKERIFLTCSEVMAICKIILETRAFNEAEFKSLIDKLLMQASPSDERRIREAIREEVRNYIGPRHGKDLFKKIWDFNTYAKTHEYIKIKYVNKYNDPPRYIEIKPLEITFSNFYFYIMAYADGDETNPIAFRIDRCLEIIRTKKFFPKTPQKSFNLDNFKKRVYCMYTGDLIILRFKFWGPNLDAVRDRLPTARVLIEKDKDGKALIEAETYSRGIKKWIFSQIDCLEVLEPLGLREEIKTYISNMAAIYEK